MFPHHHYNSYVGAHIVGISASTYTTVLVNNVAWLSKLIHLFLVESFLQEQRFYERLISTNQNIILLMLFMQTWAIVKQKNSLIKEDQNEVYTIANFSRKKFWFINFIVKLFQHHNLDELMALFKATAPLRPCWLIIHKLNVKWWPPIFLFF